MNAFTRRNQRYEVIGERPHLRMDGTPTTVFELRTNCKKCGTGFTCTAGPKDLAEATRYLVRSCPSCRPKRPPPRAKCVSCGQRLPEKGSDARKLSEMKP